MGKTPPFRGPHGEVVAGSIAEIAYRRLGGFDQWVMIHWVSYAIARVFRRAYGDR